MIDSSHESNFGIDIHACPINPPPHYPTHSVSPSTVTQQTEDTLPTLPQSDLPQLTTTSTSSTPVPLPQSTIEPDQPIETHSTTPTPVSNGTPPASEVTPAENQNNSVPTE